MDNKKNLLLRKKLAAHIGILNNSYIDDDIKTIVKSRCEEILKELKGLGSNYRLAKTESQYMLVDSQF